MTRSVIGARIRERRRILGIKQADLARRVGISPSYLNLIEKNRRGIAGKLLRVIAETLQLSLDELDGAEERRLLDRLHEIASDPIMTALAIEEDTAGELIGRFPGWARAIVALAHAHRDLDELNRALSDRLTHDPFLGEAVHRMLTHISSMRSASEIIETVPDLDAQQRRKFDGIIGSESRRLSDVGEALAAYFDKAHTTARAVTPFDEVEALFEVRANRFDEIEAALSGLPLADNAVSARATAASHAGDAIDLLISNAPQIETEAARVRARERLIAYAEDAALLPRPKLRQMGLATRFDAGQLSLRLGLGLELICRRLTCLVPDQDVPRFGYLSANAAGAITDSRTLPGFAPTRYGSGCALWALYRAQQTPSAPIRQRVKFPSGLEFVFVAQARSNDPARFGSAVHMHTDMLICAQADVNRTVYGDAIAALDLDDVGTSCRICPHEDCAQRVADPLGV